MRPFIGLLLSMRPRQWTKNVLFVFPAIVFDAGLFDFDALGRVIICSGLLILTASSVYLFNDIVDIRADRQHPVKKHRPIAAGDVPAPVAAIAAAILAAAALAGSLALHRDLSIILAAYILLQVAYSLWIKQIALLDILAVSAGFVLRILAGGVVAEISLSPWLTTCAGLLALFLVIGKRRQELKTLGDAARAARSSFRHYNLALLDELLRIVTACVLITYVIYTAESATMIRHGQNLGLLTVPIVIYGVFRYLYLIHVEGEGSAPDEVLMTDRPLQLTLFIAALTYFVIIYVL
ncbi:MAG: decaprenyl-phosphate phosphoribosyltransferase [Chloroflexi bacterium]|nr:decaprenyl-phosphate phosphoribosyltransferase [Chloroflexota bacterium]